MLLFQLVLAVTISASLSESLANTGNIFTDFWEWRMKNAPEFATFVGRYDYDDRLDEMSLDSYARRAKDIEALLERSKKMPKPSQDLQLLITELEQFLEGQKFTSYVWPMNNLEVR